MRAAKDKRYYQFLNDYDPDASRVGMKDRFYKQ